ncbi:MAG: hypothetical protein WC838_04420 [Candidatus Margulisiibacteriota bacterium]|jgi:hypothetical protein
MTSDLASSLPLTFSEKKEVEQNIREITLRDDISTKKLFSKLGLNKLLAGKLSPQEKIARVRQLLNKARFPMLAAWEEEFAQWKKELKLPPDMHLQHAPNFEQDWLELKFRVQNKKDLKAKLAKLSALAKKLP